MMLHILNQITSGQGTMEDLDTLESLAREVRETALCGLGKTAPNPVLTTLRYFRNEYEDHILRKKCSAHVCRQLNTYTIIAEHCTGCTRCARECPQEAISGDRKQPHTIDQSICVKCGLCFDVCRFDAIRIE